MNTYTITYTTNLGEIRTAKHTAGTPDRAVASFIAHQIYRDDAAAADLHKPVTALWESSVL